MHGRMAFDDQPHWNVPNQIANLDTGRYEAAPWIMLLPNFSPDGTRLAFGVSPTPGWTDPLAVFIGRPPLPDLTQITPWTRGAWSPCWSPDGSHIAYVESRPGQARIWVVDVADPTDSRPIWNGDASIGRLTWSAAGIVGGPHFIDETDQRERPEDHFVLVQPDGSGARRVRPTSVGDPALTLAADPAWSPDGSAIAYVEHLMRPSWTDSYERVNSKLCIITAPGWDEPTVLFEQPTITWPAWSPDSQALAISVFTADGPGDGLWIIDRDGRNAHQPTFNGAPLVGVGELYLHWGPQTRVGHRPPFPPRVPALPWRVKQQQANPLHRYLVTGAGQGNRIFVDPLWDPAPPGRTLAVGITAGIVGGLVGYAAARAIKRR